MRHPQASHLSKGGRWAAANGSGVDVGCGSPELAKKMASVLLKLGECEYGNAAVHGLRVTASRHAGRHSQAFLEKQIWWCVMYTSKGMCSVARPPVAFDVMSVQAM